MKIRCQLHTDKHRLPHGEQEVLRRLLRYGLPERVQLACGCDFPLNWVPKRDQEKILRDFPKSTRYVGQPQGVTDDYCY